MLLRFLLEIMRFMCGLRGIREIMHTAKQGIRMR